MISEESTQEEKALHEEKVMRWTPATLLEIYYLFYLVVSVKNGDEHTQLQIKKRLEARHAYSMLCQTIYHRSCQRCE